MKIHALILFSIHILIITSCSGDHELERSVFIHDPVFTDLPLYSEWGYNTFGAYYDGEPFISNDYNTPVRILVSEDSMSFNLYGQIGPVENNPANPEMTMTFILPGFEPEKYQDLTIFDNQIIDLKNSAWKVLISIDNVDYIPVILSGELQFNRVQDLMVDKSPREVILSGHFEFQASINGDTVSVSNGRFDAGINELNFFRQF